MNDYILLMHNDVPDSIDNEEGPAWSSYLAKLRETGNFEGGSAIGGGICVGKTGIKSAVTSHLAGYIRVKAESLDAAKELVTGNPVFEAGGTIEIRELPRTN